MEGFDGLVVVHDGDAVAVGGVAATRWWVVVAGVVVGGGGNLEGRRVKT